MACWNFRIQERDNLMNCADTETYGGVNSVAFSPGEQWWEDSASDIEPSVYGTCHHRSHQLHQKSIVLTY
jgi:hypothetical protein